MKISDFLRFAVFACGLAHSAFHFSVLAAPSDLDLSFGSNGKVATAIGSHNDSGYCMAMQDDRILVAGRAWTGSSYDFALVRYNSDGGLDTSFGSGGKVTTAFSAGADVCRAIAVQGDGKIVLAGGVNTGNSSDIGLVRYNANGTLDTTFGNVGKVITPVGGGWDSAYSVKVQNDGKIVAAGISNDGSSDRFCLVRYDSSGALDTGFGSGGKVVTAVGADSNDFAWSVALQDDGKIVLAGLSLTGNDSDVALVRYSPNGTLDMSFGNGGKVLTAIGNQGDFARAVVVQGDGKIVVAGHLWNISNHDIALVRYNADGSLDTSFGNGGKVRTDLGNTHDYGNSVALQENGKIVVAGVSYTDSLHSEIALLRYNANGNLDTSFGKVRTSVGSGEDVGAGMAVQRDGRIVVAGQTWNGSNEDFVLLRYIGDPVKPSVTTGELIWATTTSAHFSGDVTPNGTATAVFFEVAKEADPYAASGNVTAQQSPLSGHTIQSVTGTKTGLLPHTTYKFRVSARNGGGTSVGEDVTFTTANSQPVAHDKAIHPEAGNQQAIFSVASDASDADRDSLTVTVLSYDGTGTVNVTPQGVVNYTGGAFNGTETVLVEVSDGFGGSDRATITLSNAAPLAAPDIVHAVNGGHRVIRVLANDSDADGDSLELLSFTQSSHGEVRRAVNNRNLLIYFPEAGFLGEDTFTYTMSDGRSAPVTETVKVTVGLRLNPVNSMVLSTASSVPGDGEEGNGIPLGATWKSFGEPAINDAGQVAVLGNWKSPEGSGSGIFLDEELVVKAGDPVPGLAEATFKSFKDPVLNGAGGVAFLATITGSEVRKNNDTVLVSNAFSGELELIAREGALVPETGEARFGKFYSISLQGDSSDDAGLLFTASLLKASGNPKVKPENDLGAWLRTPALGDFPRKVVREGDPGFAAGEKIKSFQLLQALSGSLGQGRGHYKADEVSFMVTLTSKRQALVRFSAGTLEAEEFTGALVGAALPKAKWSSFGLPANDASGIVNAVRATLQNGLGGVTKANATGIFLSTGVGEEYAPVVRVGDEAFGVPDAVFSAFKDPLVAGWNLEVAFLGTVKGKGIRPGNNTGIWSFGPTGWNLIARAGTQAVEAPEGARWKSFTSLALPNSERGPLFVATLAMGAGSVNASNNTGIWAVDSGGNLRLLVREQDPVGEKTLKSFPTMKAVSGSPGVRRSFNNAGQLVYRAYFTDGSQGVVKVQVP